MSEPTATDKVQKASDIEAIPKAAGDIVEDLERHTATDDVELEVKVLMVQEKYESTDNEAEQVKTSHPSKPIQMERAKAQTEASDKKKDDEKLGIYKALAIKLKKELVKTRDELQKLKEEYKKVVDELKSQVKQLEKTLELERVQYENTNLTLEATCKNLKSQLDAAEEDLNSLQTEFDSYKIRATKIMQQNNLSVAISNRTFDEDRYKQMRALNEEQKRQIATLNSQIETLTVKNEYLELQFENISKEADLRRVRNEEIDKIQSKCNSLIHENETLREDLKKIKERHYGANTLTEKQTNKDKNKQHKHSSDQKASVEISEETQAKHRLDLERLIDSRESAIQISPSSSVKDENQTNSSPSSDSSSYGYVHIKPTAFEIISRTSVLEDAQNQIDNLTKAYLDSESTNSLLSEQVSALKEEIRRLQRGNERIELANNLEYLKNVIFKYLSLDNSQVEQKQRLIPVLTTVLKLSREETQKLNSLALTDKTGITSSFFGL